MQKRGKWMVASVVLLGVIAMIWSAFRPTGPIYKGKRLSVWLDSYYPEGARKWSDSEWAAHEVNAQANEAVRGLGTNAIPYLLDLLRTKDSRLKTYLLENIQPGRETKPFVPADLGYWRANQAFLALGPTVSRPAIPELINILRDPATDVVNPGDFAARILADIGVDSVPGLSKALKDSPECLQRRAACVLGLIGEAAEPAVPGLVYLLEAPETRVRYEAVLALGRIAKQPTSVVPALAKRLKDSDRWVRRSAADALRQYGDQAREAAPALVAALSVQNPNGEDTLAIGKALNKVAPEEALKNMRPLLRSLLRGEDIDLTSVTNFLADIHGSRNAAIPVVVELANENLEFAKENVRLRTQVRILFLLRTFGSDAKAALPRLQSMARELLANPEAKLKLSLAGTLYAIAPEQALEQVVALVKDTLGSNPDGIRHMAIYLGSDVSISILTTMLDNSDIQLQLHAVSALGKLGPIAAAALPKLSSLIKSSTGNPDQDELSRLAADAVKAIERPRRLQNQLTPSPNAYIRST